jgi:hypothetical protein
MKIMDVQMPEMDGYVSKPVRVDDLAALCRYEETHAADSGAAYGTILSPTSSSVPSAARRRREQLFEAKRWPGPRERRG